MVTTGVGWEQGDGIYKILYMELVSALHCRGLKAHFHQQFVRQGNLSVQVYQTEGKMPFLRHF